MRAHGTLSEIPAAGISDHVCWVYGADDPAFDRAVRRFLAGGLDRAERLLCVGERVIESLRTESDGFGGTDELISRGALRAVTMAEVYDASRVFVPGDQRSFYADATEQAIADGYTGLRVVADVSELAADPDTRADLAQWEHLADECIAQGSGFTAMCAYSAAVPEDALADIAAVHPLVHSAGGPPPFQVFFDEGRVVLTGSIDTFGADRLARVLAATPVPEAHAVLDLGLADFVDVAGARVIARWSRELDARSIALDVRGTSPLFRRMWQLLALDRLAPVRFAEAAA